MPGKVYLDKIMFFFTEMGQEKGIALNTILAVGFLRPGSAFCMVVFYFFCHIIWPTHKWYAKEPRPALQLHKKLTKEHSHFECDYGFPSGHALGSHVYILMFALFSSQEHFKSLHDPQVKLYGYILTSLFACAITASRHYRFVHSYDQLLAGFVEGIALLWLVISGQDYLIWFREDFMASCSLFQLFFNPILNSYNFILFIGILLQVNEVKPAWYRQIEKLNHGSANDC